MRSVFFLFCEMVEWKHKKKVQIYVVINVSRANFLIYLNNMHAAMKNVINTTGQIYKFSTKTILRITLNKDLLTYF